MFISIKNSKLNSVNIIFYSYIISYILGPAIINIFVTLLSFFGVVVLIKNYFNQSLLISNLSKILIFFFLYILLIELLSEEFNFHFISFLRYLIIFIFFENFRFKKEDFNFNYLFIILIIISIDGIFQYFNGTNFLGFQKFENFRLTGMFDDEPIIGSFLMKISIPILWLSVINKNSYLKNFSYYIFFIVVFSCIVLSFERMPIIQIFLSLIFMFFISFFYDTKITKRISIIFIFSLVSAYLLISSNNFLKYRTEASFNALHEIFVVSDVSKIKSISIKDYIGHINLSNKLWSENKFFGGGYRNFNYYCSKNSKKGIDIEGCSTHPHNIYLELLTDTGIIGLFIFFIFNGILIFKSLKRIPIRMFGFIFSYAVMLFPFVTSQSLFSSYYGSIFFLYPFILNYYLSNGLNKNEK